MRAIGLVMLVSAIAVAAPPPPEPPENKPVRNPVPNPNMDREAWVLAEWLSQTAVQISEMYVKPVDSHVLVGAALEELFQEAGIDFPEHFRKRLQQADSINEQMRLIHQIRVALGNIKGLDGAKAMIVAGRGFQKKTDEYCRIFAPSNVSFASSDSEFGIGLELELADLEDWLAFQIEWRQGNRAATDRSGVPIRPPWKVKRVIPGSPAANAGVQPGDVIRKFDNFPITERSSPQLFRKLMAFAVPNAQVRPDMDAEGQIELELERAEVEEPIRVKIRRKEYIPESVFGVKRNSNGNWDYMLDRDAKIGYIRITQIELNADEVFESAMASLIRENANGVIIDLRWCPGGYLTPSGKIAGLVLPQDKLIARIEGGRDFAQPRIPHLVTESERGRSQFLKLPIVVLVGPDTSGGGEMIATAWQFYNRASVLGQRTAGRANVMSLVDTRFSGISFRVSTGYTLRPDGSTRHRLPESTPADDWGVRPDRGGAIPMTPDLNAKLKAGYEAQVIRPLEAKYALPIDDPLADPARLLALRFLSNKLANREPKD